MRRSMEHAGDLSSLPDYAFGPTALGWWGVVGFMLIEGMGFVLAVGAYYYLLPNEARWPPEYRPPPLFWGTLFTLVAIASEIPNVWVAKRAKEQNLQAVQVGLIIMIGIGLLLLVIRAFEMAAMNVRWDITAYGSIVWAIIALHTFHTVTDWYDSVVLGVMAHVHRMDGRKFSDVNDNSLYWHFIVWSWVALYVVVYWTPRWL
jgi:cytochrome c oxidase subunit III